MLMLMLTAGVPLALVSKTLRDSNVAITADLYGHLTEEAAQAAADSLGSALDAARCDAVCGTHQHEAAPLGQDADARVANADFLRRATTLRSHRGSAVAKRLL
jgi:hypothetical protein